MSCLIIHNSDVRNIIKKIINRRHVDFDTITSNSRDKYVINVRKEICHELSKIGIKNSDISLLLNKNINTIIKYIKKHNNEN